MHMISLISVTYNLTKCKLLVSIKIVQNEGNSNENVYNSGISKI